MASSNHVQSPPIPNTNSQPPFSDHDMYAYNNAYFNSAQDQQPFDPQWTVDPNLSLAAPQTTQTTNTPAFSQPWQNSPVHQHQQSHTQSQSQNAAARSSVYNPAATFYARSFSNSPVPHQNPGFAQNNFNRYQDAIDPSITSASPVGLQSRPANPVAHPTGTITPAALQAHNTAARQTNTPTYPDHVSNHTPSQQPLPRPTPVARPFPLNVPKGTYDGKTFTVTDENSLVKAMQSTRLHNFVHVSNATYDVPIKEAAIPNYVPRKSRRELKAMASQDPKLLSKIAKRSKSGKLSKTVTPKVDPAKSLMRSARSSAEPKEDESSSEEDTSDDSDYASSDSELEITEPSPLPPSRPQRAIEAVRYDTIKALWFPKRRIITTEQIRSGLKAYWEVVRTIRDRWRLDGDAVKQAIELKKIKDLDLLRERVASQRDMMEMAFKAALEHGHPSILRLFSENKPFLGLSSSFLADRNRENDFDGPMSTAALELLVQCTTLTKDKLEAANLPKVLARYTKKGNNKTQSLVKRILQNGANATQSTDVTKNEKAEAAKPAGSKVRSEPPQPARRPVPEAATGLKRARSVEGAGQPAKRIATAPAGASKAVGTVKRPNAAADKSTAPSGTANSAKPKVNQVVSKPTNFFAGLQSASKKSATTNGAAGVGSSVKKPATSAVPATKAKFSFNETMASLTRPKEQPASTKPEDVRPPETAEEKAKRLRKEQRRKMHVTWKDDAILCDIRLFTHDPEEETGRDPNMVRDFGDLGSEGRMFKQHHDKDIDDEEERVEDDNMMEWRIPSDIDFTDISQEERTRNYWPYGGGETRPTSGEIEVQQQRESTTLLAYYLDKNDIPPSPREPNDLSTEEVKPYVPFGPISDLVRTRQAALPPPPPQPGYGPNMNPPSNNTNPPDVQAILQSLLATQPQQNTPMRPVAPMPAAGPVQAQTPSSDTTNLESIFAQFSAQNAAAAQQAATPAYSAPAPDHSAAPEASLEAILANLRAHTSGPSQPAQPFPPAPGTAADPAAAATQPVDISSILAMVYQNTQQQQPQPQAPAPMPPMPAFGNGFNFNMGYNPQQQDQNQNNQGPREDPGRKRQREANDEDDYNQDGRGGGDGHRGGGGGNRKKSKWGKKRGGGGGGSSGGGREPPKFIYACTYYQLGNCKRGANCTFRHDD
ncbi:hypothetical protein K402DRAFT_404695 [Aulographum hederae CBS 113979]|uniref:C3H1-type domain-containing protein n=1 Tax=Aulographum hederae CBS 113979 TaxID=1176131 RepID=A0A6G1GZ83_9PEZI|nr:hypothetical protein K402DRAFT_404695 [Aulographum hederae CBS 113979]